MLLVDVKLEAVDVHTVYPMMHYIFSPHLCTTTALSYKIPVRVRKQLFLPDHKKRLIILQL